jgi:hypothetical protein
MTEPDAGRVWLQRLVRKSRPVDRLRAVDQSRGIAFTPGQHGQGPVPYALKVAGAALESYPVPDDTSTADRTTRLGSALSSLAQAVEPPRASGTAVPSLPRRTAGGYRAVVQGPDGRPVELDKGSMACLVI